MDLLLIAQKNTIIKNNFYIIKQMSLINRILRNSALHNIKIQQSKKDDENRQIIENNKKGLNLGLIIISQDKNIKITSPNTVEAIPIGDNSQWSSRVQSSIGFKDHCELSFKVSNYYTFVCLTSNPTYPNRDIIKYPNAGLYFDQPSSGFGKLTAIYNKEKVNKNFDIWESNDIFKIILENSEFNISEIAYQVGFNDPAYFTRAFKKQYGKSPKSFIQQIQDEKS